MVKKESFYKSGRPIEFKTCARTKEQAPIISKIRTMIITNFFPFIIFTSEGLYQIFNTQWNKIQDYYTLISTDECKIQQAGDFSLQFIGQLILLVADMLFLLLFVCLD